MNNIYPKHFEEKVGFDRIRDMLHNRCLGVMGRELIDTISFQSDFEIIAEQLGETNEFCKIIRETENFPTDHYYDLRNALQKIKIEGRFMEVDELFDLKRSLESVQSIIKFFNRQEDTSFPLLKKRSQKVRVYPYIYDRIDSILNKFGKIKDNASPLLNQIRKDIKSLEAGISRRLNAILKRAQKEGVVEADAAVTIRDGRAVIPVISSHKRKIKGIVYDESATGKTFYIEPNEIVEINNEIRELEYKERREIVNILVSLSDDIRPYLFDLIESYNFLGEIDFIRAKALIAIEFNAIFPEMERKPLIKWIQAVHPLLKQTLQRENRTLVPLDINLDEKDHILLISGPNAGGKSVCLKTVGLLQYMLQCGLLIPLKDGSRVGLFEKLFIDIGDEQSLENDLSTYSSHLLNMKYFTRYCDDKTLILIDEFGTGTEPMLGGAIAEAILDKINRLGAYGVITTHYTNLKHFASSNEGIINGAMLYDSQNMNPLFILEIGKPGSSFAFEIARKIGLSEEILKNATDKIGEKHIDYDRSLRKISRDKRYWETKRKKIRNAEKQIDALVEKYEAGLKDISKERKNILKEAKTEASQLLSGVNKQIEKTILDIRKAAAEKEKTMQARQNISKLRERVEEFDQNRNDRIEKRINALERKKKSGKKPRGSEKRSSGKSEELQKGDIVRIIGQNVTGILMELSKKNAVIAYDQLITTTAPDKIELVKRKEERKKSKTGQSSAGRHIMKDMFERKLNFKPEIDVRGDRSEEAIAKIQELLDEAIMFEVDKLRILHGKGHGLLKESIRNYLRSEPIVRDIKDEHVDFGGAGITVVRLSI